MGILLIFNGLDCKSFYLKGIAINLFRQFYFHGSLRGRPHMMSHFFKGLLTYLPTYVQFCPIALVLFYLIVYNFCKLSYLLTQESDIICGWPLTALFVNCFNTR